MRKSQEAQDQLAENFLQKNKILVDSGVTEFQRFADSIGTQASDALAAGITDGALNGFDNFSSIAKSLFSSIGSQGLNLLVKAGFNLLGSFADGGDFVADRPGLIQVGERGAERVRVEPLTGSRAGRGTSGGGGETVNLSLTVNGSLGNLSRSELKNLVKSAYMEVATKGYSVRRLNASQARRSLQ